MSDKAKALQPKLRLQEAIEHHDAATVLELITPTARTFQCQRNGHLVDGGYCALFCPIGKEMVVFDPTGGIEVVCPFAYNNFLGRMGDGVSTDA
ncbi:MAG: hypothetical protein ACFFDU_08755 [Candidatus Thorarchaeota archaeon]